MSAAPLMSERRVSLIAAILVALGPVSMSLYTPAMPQLVAAFDTTPAVIKATMTFYFAGFAVSQLVAGPVADAFGRRAAALSFIALYILGSLLATIAPTVEALIAARLIQGIGSAVGQTVARAIVRDLYSGETGARIMNTVAIMLAAAPAFSPAIGGVTMALAGWHMIFVLMVVAGVIVGAIVAFMLKETGQRDRSHVKPARIVRNYWSLARNAEFLSSGLTAAFGVGVLYALATLLPFVLIDEVGMHPTTFGFAMMAQSLAFLFGSLVFRVFARWTSPRTLVLPGLAFFLVGGALMAVLPHLAGASPLTVMGPVAVYAFGVAFVMPFMMMAGLIPFPHIAGSASAMAGFMQMGGGLLGGSVAAAVGAPLLAFSTVIPAMGVLSILSYCWYLSATRRTRRRHVDEVVTHATVAPAE